MTDLEHGDAPWTRATGLVVRGYVSKIDGGVQPYGLAVPASYAPDRPHKWRVDTWFHGRTETLSEVSFLWDRIHNPAPFMPRDTIVLLLYGRYCNASTFAGEVDLFEALADVKKNFSVDDDRVLVRGFSIVGMAYRGALRDGFRGGGTGGGLRGDVRLLRLHAAQREAHVVRR
jgi:hypothetical protein